MSLTSSERIRAERKIKTHSSLSKVLTDFRTVNGLSQRKLAYLIGINFTYLNKLEKGTNPYPPSEKVIQKIAQVCDRPVQEIYYLSGRIDPKDAEIARDLFKIYGDCFTKFLHKMHDDPNFADNIIEQLSAS